MRLLELPTGSPSFMAEVSALAGSLFAVMTLQPLSTKALVANNPTPEVVPVIKTVPGAA
tara:strand:- start:2721 stop:2897 length:177 start_codon:yes stop_codon:yes gene_type:complete